MLLESVELSFNRAVQDSISKKKILFTSPLVILCGLFFVICRTIAINSGSWIQLFLGFFPFFLSFGILLGAGVVLIKAYYLERKKEEHSFKKIIYQSYQMIMNIAYLALPFVMAYIAIWIVLGIFYLLKSIPFLGALLGPMLSFIPFILILTSLLLALSTVFFLFFATPEATLKTGLKLILIKKTAARVKKSFFTDLIMIIVSLIPLLISLSLLYGSSWIVTTIFFEGASEVSFAFESLFMMLPFCLFLTPSVIFFFNFAAESFLLDQKEEIPA